VAWNYLNRDRGKTAEVAARENIQALGSDAKEKIIRGKGNVHEAKVSKKSRMRKERGKKEHLKLN